MIGEGLEKLQSQTYFRQSSFYFQSYESDGDGFMNALLKAGDETDSDSADVKTETKPSYTRVVTANFIQNELNAVKLSNGKIGYAYQGTVQKFEIRINVSGDSRSYTAVGTDKDGNEFEKEIDPYNVDPADSDFTEFAALCSYIRDTENLADETMLALDGVAPSDILEKRNYVSELSASMSSFQMSGVSSLRPDSLLSHINRLMEVLMQAGAESWNIRGLYGDSGVSQNEVIADSSDDSQLDNSATIEKSLGMGTVLVGNDRGYGMSARQIINPDSDDVIVRVGIATGDGQKWIDVNLSEVDPKNATAIEMFAYCQYADANGTGTGSTFGSWHDLKSVIDPVNGMRFDSLDDAENKRMDWSGALAASDTVLTKKLTGESIDATALLKMLEETMRLLIKNGADRDLGELTDEQWEALLGEQ